MNGGDIVSKDGGFAAIIHTAKRARGFAVIGHSAGGESADLERSSLRRPYHNGSQRADKPFLAINCGALPDSLVESTLFGYEHGAFTGARKGRTAGYFRAGRWRHAAA